jgi:hypothetical protein
MTRTVRDCALMFELIAGHDPRDATSSRPPAPRSARARGPLSGLRLALPENYYFDGVTAEVKSAVEAAARTLESRGARVLPLRLPDPAGIVDVCNVLARAESASIHSRVLRERPHELGAAVRAAWRSAVHVSAHDYLQAGRLRARWRASSWTRCSARSDAIWRPPFPSRLPAGGGDRGGGGGDRPPDGALLAAHATVQRSGSAGAARAVRTLGRRAAAGPADRGRPVRRGHDLPAGQAVEQASPRPRRATDAAASSHSHGRRSPVAPGTSSRPTPQRSPACSSDRIAIETLHTLYPDVPEAALLGTLPGALAGASARSTGLVLTLVLVVKAARAGSLRCGGLGDRPAARGDGHRLARAGPGARFAAIVLGLRESQPHRAIRRGCSRDHGPDLFGAVVVLG